MSPSVWQRQCDDRQQVFSWSAVRRQDGPEEGGGRREEGVSGLLDQSAAGSCQDQWASGLRESSRGWWDREQIWLRLRLSNKKHFNAFSQLKKCLRSNKTWAQITNPATDRLNIRYSAGCSLKQMVHLYFTVFLRVVMFVETNRGVTVITLCWLKPHGDWAQTVCQLLGLSCDAYPPLIGSLLGFETSVSVHINVFQFLISHKKRPKHKDLFYRWQRKVSRSFLLSWIFGVSRCKVFTATQCSLVKPWDNMIGDIFFILHDCRYSL